MPILGPLSHKAGLHTSTVFVYEEHECYVFLFWCIWGLHVQIFNMESYFFLLHTQRNKSSDSSLWGTSCHFFDLGNVRWHRSRPLSVRVLKNQLCGSSEGQHWLEANRTSFILLFLRQKLQPAFHWSDCILIVERLMFLKFNLTLLKSTRVKVNATDFLFHKLHWGIAMIIVFLSVFEYCSLSDNNFDNKAQHHSINWWLLLALPRSSFSFIM